MNKNSPIAPDGVGFWVAYSLRRLGKRDARAHLNHQSGTHTNVTRRLEARANLGQHDANNWLAQVTESAVGGNLVIDIQRKSLVARATEINGRSAQTERAASQKAAQLDEIADEIRVLDEQQALNSLTIENLTAQAFFAWKSWSVHYEHLARIYSDSMQRRISSLRKGRPGLASSDENPPYRDVAFRAPAGFEAEAF